MLSGSARTKLIASIAVACLLMFAWWMRRDLSLAGDTSKIGAPDITIERFSFKREIGGREWNVDAVSAEHRSGMITANSITVLMDDISEDRSAQMEAVSGEFSRDRDEMILHETRGSLSFDGRSADIKARAASCDSSTGRWSFYDGVLISLDRSSMIANKGTIDEDGEMMLRGGVIAEWVFEDL